MGAITFCETAIGTSAREAFSELKRNAMEIYGCDSYNGTISTCDGFVVVKTYDICKETKQREKEVNALINKAFAETGKWGHCHCIDLGVMYYERIIVKEVKQKADAKYAQKYVLEYTDEYGNFKVAGTADTKGELKAKVGGLVFHGADNIRIVKRPVKISGNDVSSEFEIISQKSKTKPKEVNGTVEIKEVHKYVFAGWAAE